MKQPNGKVATPIPAATVVPLRDGDDGVEILLLRRNARLDFVGGAWVFPGGRLDEEDYAQAPGRDELIAARHAAVREAHEESGLTLALDQLVCLSHWTTPGSSPKRFATWFFLAPLSQPQQVVIDGSEIHEHRWYRPQAALDAYLRDEIFIIMPTYHTIEALIGFADCAELLARYRNAAPTVVPPEHGKIMPLPTGRRH